MDLKNRNVPIDSLRFQSNPETFKIKSLTKMKRLIQASEEPVHRHERGGGTHATPWLLSLSSRSSTVL